MKHQSHTSWRSPPHEQAALEHVLLGDLRDMLDEQPDPDATRWLLAVLDTLLDVLPGRFAHEERGGYLAEVIDEFPTWETEVYRLRRERAELHRRLWLLREHVRRHGRSAPLSEFDTRELRAWIDRIEQHDHQETGLLQTAVNLEIGGEG